MRWCIIIGRESFHAVRVDGDGWCDGPGSGRMFQIPIIPSQEQCRRAAVANRPSPQPLIDIRADAADGGGARHQRHRRPRRRLHLSLCVPPPRGKARRRAGSACPGVRSARRREMPDHRHALSRAGREQQRRRVAVQTRPRASPVRSARRASTRSPPRRANWSMPRSPAPTPARRSPSFRRSRRRPPPNCSGSTANSRART